MFGPNAYRIRFATGEDAETLRDLADRDSEQPLVGRVLIGQLNGKPAAALSLHDGRVIADPSRRTDQLAAALRTRAGAIRAFEATPSLADRLRAAFASYNGGSAPAPSRNGYAAHNGRAARIGHGPHNGHAAPRRVRVNA
jgi:hypothetical protein